MGARRTFFSDGEFHNVEAFIYPLQLPDFFHRGYIHKPSLYDFVYAFVFVELDRTLSCLLLFKKSNNKKQLDRSVPFS